jgi:phospholipid transport system substrate-binding protein
MMGTCVAFSASESTLIRDKAMHDQHTKWSVVFVFAICGLSLILLAPGALGNDIPPTQTIEKLNAALLQSMKGGQNIGYQGRYALLAPVLDECFAFDLMTRIAVGKKHWQNWDTQQRAQLVALNREWSIAQYADRFDRYNGQQFKLAKPPQIKRSIAVLSSNLTKKDGKVTEFLYKLKKTQDRWRIVDIQVKGVSQLANSRAQFKSILDKDGYEGLVARLNEKIAKISTK